MMPSLMHSVSARSDMAWAIRFLNFSLWYGALPVLCGIDLQIRRGSVTVLIGPGGCGKSSLLRSVVRLDEHLDNRRTAGVIEVFGQDIQAPAVELSALRRQVGLVVQRPELLPLSIRENVLFGYRLHGGAVGRSAKGAAEALVEEALRRVLLWERLKDRLDQPAAALGLSLAERQGVCIARLLPLKPSLLLLDDPCAALDDRGAAAVEELIWELRGRYSIVMVTHDLAQARRVGEVCVFMSMGRVVEWAAAGEMFVTPRQQACADYIEGRCG